MNPTGHLKLNETTIALSDPLTATIAIESNGPFAVKPPVPLLAESSRQCWQIQLAGPAAVLKLPDGRERWTQCYKLEPFVAGNAVPVEFRPFLVEATTTVPVAFPAQHVSVQTTVSSATEPRPLAGVESLPDLAAPMPSNWPVAAAFLILLLTAAMLLLIRRRPAPPVNPIDLYRRRLAQLETLSQDKPFAAGLSRLVREIAESQTGEPFTTRTTSELESHPFAVPYLTILQQCDATMFAGEPMVNRDELVWQANALLPD